jgi:hypothetical protein
VIVLILLQRNLSGNSAELSFRLGGDAQAIEVAVGGMNGASASSLLNEQVYTPVKQPDGSYKLTVTYPSAEEGYFLIRWRDANGDRIVGQAQSLVQSQLLGEVDARLNATADGTGNYDVNVSWDISEALAGGTIHTSPGTGDYEVYVSILADHW